MWQVFITFCTCFVISLIFNSIEFLLDVNFTRVFFSTKPNKLINDSFSH